MTLKELHYLVALADQGRFGRAAVACHVGQPTLSTQLKKLEDYLGVTLFERNKHYLLPTPVGEEIIERARIVLDVVEQIRQLARQGDDPMTGALRLGVIPTLGPYLIPHLLSAIRASFPKLHLFLREDLTANLLERLRQGRLDALLLALPVHGDDIEAVTLFREPFVVALPAGHALEENEEIRVAVVATVGLSNATAAGLSPAAVCAPSTINIIVVVDAELEPGALVNAVITATEAKYRQAGMAATLITST